MKQIKLNRELAVLFNKVKGKILSENPELDKVTDAIILKKALEYTIRGGKNVGCK